MNSRSQAIRFGPRRPDVGLITKVAHFASAS